MPNRTRTQRGVLMSSLSATLVGSGLLAASASGALADEALADLVEQVSPAVVTVLSSREITPGPDAADRFGIPEGSPFEEFFRQFGRDGDRRGPLAPQQPREGLGSGFILDEDGLIVTNHHVIAGADEVTIRLKDDRVFKAEVIGTDEQTDLAVLQIDAGETLPFVSLGDSGEIRVGEDVMAVGNPFGLGGTVTSGIVSAKGRNIAAGPYAEFIQTDAAINRGNSGGPLFNMDGEVVGVNSAIYSPTGGSVGVGFSIASNTVELVVDDLLDDGEIDRGWLGVSIQGVSPDIAAAVGLDETRGALVASVLEDGPSVDALRAGDIILEFEGQTVASSGDLPRLVGAAKAETEAKLVVFRDGETETITVRLGAFEVEEAAVVETEARDSADETLGATVAPVTETARAEIGLDDSVDGLVITSLKATGPAARAGLQVGDVILRVGSNEVMTTDDLDQAFEAQDAERALMLINRSGRQLFVAVELV